MKQFCNKTTKTSRQIIFFVLFSLFTYSNGFSQISAPTHFATVWQGENGLNHMNFVVISAILDDLQLGSGDEIAVFSGSNCVGQATLAQSINTANSSTFLTFKASQNDGSSNGFTENDTIIFKIWDNKNQKEMIAKTVKYKNDLTNWTTNGKFSAGATAVIEIVSYTEYTQTIQLIKGANLFSTYVTPSNPNVSSVMKSLCDQGALISVLDEVGNPFSYVASSGGWVNEIGSVAKTEGYSINVNFNSTLTLTGKQVVLPLDIPLKLGWNYISFPRMDFVNAMSVIQPLISQKKLIKVQDEKGYTIEKIKGSWKNNIGNFVSGEAYKINVSAACILTIQSSYIKSTVSITQPEKTEYFSPVYEGNGLDHMNISLIGLAESGLTAGDELAAFDGSFCVGSVKMNKDHLIQGSVSLITSFATNQENQNGFFEGHSISMYKWNKLTGDVSTIQAEEIIGELKFERLASIEINLKSATTSVSSIENENQFNIFPNPANDMITVRFSKMPEVGRMIEIADISGRKIASREVHGISEVFLLENPSAGLYFVKSILGKDETVQKLILK